MITCCLVIRPYEESFILTRGKVTYYTGVFVKKGRWYESINEIENHFDCWNTKGTEQEIEASVRGKAMKAMQLTEKDIKFIITKENTNEKKRK